MRIDAWRRIDVKVLVRAYMAVNLGDDLFLDTLFRRFPDVDFEIESWYYDRYKKFIACYPNVSIRKNGGFLPRVKEKFGIYDIDKAYVKKFDAVIYIGGSIFKENPENDLLDILCEKEVEFSKKKNIPYYFVSCNFEDKYSEEFFERKRRMFENSEKVFFRDRYSYELFKEIKSVEYSEDFVFLSPHGKRLSAVEPKKILGISVIDLESRKSLSCYEEEYFEFLKNSIKEYADLGYKTRLFAFSKPEGDLKAAERILNMLDNDLKKSVEIEAYSGDIEKTLFAFAECEKIICTRFHSMVLAMIFGREFYPIIYSGKQLNIIKDMDICENMYIFGRENRLVFGKYENNDENCDNIFRYFNQFFRVDKNIVREYN